MKIILEVCSIFSYVGYALTGTMLTEVQQVSSIEGPKPRLLQGLIACLENLPSVDLWARSDDYPIRCK